MKDYERLKQARQRAGFDSAAEASVALGEAKATYTQHENGSRGFKHKAAKYARRFQTTPEWLLYGRGEGAVQAAPIAINRMVPLLGTVQAGLFAPIPDDPEPEDMIPIVLPGYEEASLFALRIVGSSMNVYYPDGTLIVVCPAAESGVRDGDHVVVRQSRDGMVETTVKEVVQERGGVALWPRSTDPIFQSPTRITRDADTDLGPEIIGVVVSSYNVRPVQRKPLIRI